MILRGDTLAGIAAGTISVAFRRWRRPTVRSGGTLLTAIGQLGIDTVTPIEPAGITDADARQAGHRSRETLLRELDAGRDGQVYRIDFGELRPDPRIALRSEPAEASEMAMLTRKLAHMDARSATGPWTTQTLLVIRDRSGTRAADLCGEVGQDRIRFKQNVRKLKALGLTESLEVGYRLSPRGASLLEALESR